MTPVTTTTRSSAALRMRNWLPVLVAGVGAAASLAAAVGGGTVARLALATALPIGIGAWTRRGRHGRPPAPEFGALVRLGVAGAVHVVLTSPAAAWVVDSHMVPVGLVPSAGARLAVAWTVPLLWVAALVTMAVVAHRRVGTPAGALVLMAVGTAPLLVGNPFPADAYRLVWDSTALAHPSYAAGACAVFLVIALTHDRVEERPAMTGE